MTKSTETCLVILLHGVGASGKDLAPLARNWQTQLPGTIYASPDAPEPSSFGSGYQWFSVEGVTEGNRAERIAKARAGFDSTLKAIIDSHGFADRLDKVALVGFSQGTIMALDALASGRWPVGAVVGFSGRLASPLPFNPSPETPVLLIHGSADPVIPAAETEKAAAVLTALGVDVKTLVIPGLGHTISAEGADLAGEFLAKVLAKQDKSSRGVSG